MTAQVSLRAGRLYIDAATFARVLAERSAVTLVRRADDLYIVPLLDSTFGGYLCKRRTLAGDRVIDAEDFFRDHGLDDASEHRFEAAWQADTAALVVTGAFGAVRPR
jgi:hypothetical protein